MKFRPACLKPSDAGRTEQTTLGFLGNKFRKRIEEMNRWVTQGQWPEEKRGKEARSTADWLNRYTISQTDSRVNFRKSTAVVIS